MSSFVRSVGREDEVARINKFQRNFFAATIKRAKPKRIDLRDYAKYVLRDGMTAEKREFLTCLRSKLTLVSGVVKVEN